MQFASSPVFKPVRRCSCERESFVEYKKEKKPRAFQLALTFFSQIEEEDQVFDTLAGSFTNYFDNFWGVY